MMDCNKNLVAQKDMMLIFLGYIDNRDYEKPLSDQKLVADAPDEAKEAYETYKSLIEQEKKAS